MTDGIVNMQIKVLQSTSLQGNNGIVLTFPALTYFVLSKLQKQSEKKPIICVIIHHNDPVLNCPNSNTIALVGRPAITTLTVLCSIIQWVVETHASVLNRNRFLTYIIIY